MTSLDHLVSWNDIKKEFLPCVFCNQTLKDPKQLPCLHRVCRVCLNEKIEGREGDTPCCPKCSRQIRIPRNGIDGFETDVLAESVGKLNAIHLNFIQKRRQKKCCICGRRSLQLYCFKCEGYLCDRCNKRHRSHDRVAAFEGHQSALLTLRDFSSGDGNVQTIFSHIAPKCKNHPTKTASKCCDTCSNDVLCDQCLITASHSGHAIQQISDKVKLLEEDLNNVLPPIEKGIADIQSKGDNIYDTMEEVDSKIKKTSENLKASHKNELSKIITAENFFEEKYEEKILHLRNDSEIEINSLKDSRDEEIEKVREKYDKVINEKKEKVTITEEKFKTILKREKQKFEKFRATFNTNFETLLNNLNVTGTEKRAELLEMMAHFNQTVLRYENFITTLSRVLATGSDWITMKEVPVIRSAAEDLTQDINKSFPSLASLAEFPPYILEEMNIQYNESVWEEVEDPCTTEEDKTTVGTKNGQETTEL